MEIIPQNSSLNIKDPLTETTTSKCMYFYFIDFDIIKN